MPLRAAAVEIDITPPQLPIEKPGWIVKLLADRVDDPIFAKIVVIESDGDRGSSTDGFLARHGQCGAQVTHRGANGGDIPQ